LGNETPEEQALEMEAVALNKFRSQAHMYLDPSSLPEEKALLSWWALMQHFGCPTRLLDWTASPFVATYFAVVDNLDCPGAVWAFDPGLLVDRTADPEVRKARDFIGANKQVADFLWDESSPRFVHPFSLKRQHVRMSAQQGCFTVCSKVLENHGDIISNGYRADDDTLACVKFTIDSSLKMDFLRTLARMNITANSLFPGLEGLGRSVKELITLEVID
jgi:hypothetical protein